MNKKINIAIGTLAATTLLGIAVYPVPPAPMSVTEWHELADIYNYEIEQSGGSLQIKNFTSYDDLNDAIRQREQKELSPEYKVYREKLMKKVETTSLFTKYIQ